jgi:glycosyltransferase involved in cell wall biosynthesis
MRIAIFWRDLLHYHVGRIAALHTLAAVQGHHVDAFALCAASPELPHTGYQERLGAKVQVLSTDVGACGEDSAHSKRQLLAQLDRCEPDVVAIVGYTGQVARAALGWCRYHRRGALLLFDSQAKDYQRRLLQEWLKARLVSFYDAALVSGRPHAAYLTALGMAPERMLPGYNAVDNDFWAEGARQAQAAPQRWRAHYHLPERFFLTAARFVPKKNLAGLITAYAAYVRRTSRPPWSLVIVGDGELASQLRQQVAALGLTHLVHFPGYLGAEAMAAVYGLASTFILASSHAEQWGLVVNEAMAAGVPVLVSHICGCVPDLVLEGITGFSFDPATPDALTQQLLRCAEGNLDLTAMGKAGQAQIQHYSVEQFAQKLFTLAPCAHEYAQRRQWRFWPAPQLWR